MERRYVRHRAMQSAYANVGSGGLSRAHGARADAIGVGFGAAPAVDRRAIRTERLRAEAAARPPNAAAQPPAVPRKLLDYAAMMQLYVWFELEEGESQDHMNKKACKEARFSGRPGELDAYEKMRSAPARPRVTGYELRLNTRNGAVMGRAAAQTGALPSL
jgi:hypothetical protein